MTPTAGGQAARELLAGKLKWPGGATMDIVKTMSANEDLLPVYVSIFRNITRGM